MEAQGRIGMLLLGACLMNAGCGRALERVAPNWFPGDGVPPERAVASADPPSAPADAADAGDAANEADATSEPVSPEETAGEPPAPAAPPGPSIDAATVTGFSVRDLETGEGPVVGPESRVRMTFTATIVGGPEVQRVEEPVGPWSVAELIPGLAQGLAGMAVDGRRVITIPPDLGYEDTPVTDPQTGDVLIPGGSTLEYDVTLVSIENGIEPAESPEAPASSETPEEAAAPASDPAPNAGPEGGDASTSDGGPTR